MERRTRRRKPSKSLIPKLYLCCAALASGGPHFAQGGDASGSGSSHSPHGSPHDDDDDGPNGSSQNRRRHRWVPPRPHANDNYGYDSLVIDPISMFGSPHGGFSRDVSSRLSSLPLYLPSLSEERPPDNPTYLQVRDSQGQLYACRVYHQDELDSASWDDGLFELPQLSEKVSEQPSSDDAATATSAADSTSESPGDSTLVTRDGEEIKAKTATGITLRDRPDDDDVEDEVDEEGGDMVGVGNGGHGEPPQDAARTVEMVEVGMDGGVTAQAADANPLKATAAIALATKEQANEKEGDGGGDDTETEDEESEEVGGAAVVPTTYTKDDVEERLGALEGACAHIHLGWWSTEWCYKTRVRQFHVHVEQKDAAQLPHQVQILDFTSLGVFERRRIELINSNNNREEEKTEGDEATSNSNSNDLPPNPLAGNQAEIARVLDVHSAGDVCDATGEPRSTLVQLLCCAPDVMDGARQFPLPPDADPINIPPVALYGVYEDPDKLCNYVVTVCTSLLCDGLSTSSSLAPVKNAKKKGQSNEGGGKASSTSSSSSSRRAKTSKVPRENESIREILDRTLGDRCLDASTDGWWSYSYCHGERITQYHEVLEAKKTRAGVQFPERIIEAEHLLGVYQPDAVESYPNHDEWMHVVNATADRRGRGGGSGTYFEMEYTNGDVCDHSDVTDAAIIAGGAAGGAAGGVIARASTVRFFCGKTYQLAVSEDSTCHYIVEVTIPALCNHTVFKEPIMKKQVVKCLPVNEDGVAEDDVSRESDDNTTSNEQQDIV